MGEIIKRPWGSYKVLVDSASYKIKEITVNPGHRLSLQSHEERSETWTVIYGVATVTMGDVTWNVNEDECVWVEAQTKHRVANDGRIQLVFIEVQTGNSFDEEDIIRYEDDYNRV